tara:strand:+ start:754 stop:1641 length:888 start_codon:yes stop_codon:yes gene_type:complete
MNIIRKIFELLNFKISQDKIISEIEKIKFQNGLILLENFQGKQSSKIIDYEFQVFSQWGEDGIISYLVNNLDIKNNFFIEFGVGNYLESNTRFLLKKFNWSGFIIDSSQKNIDYIKKDKIYWQHNINALCEFVSRENINKIFLENVSQKNIGLLSIDIDGNDYWVWKAITTIDPSIVVIEYNSILGSSKNYTVPYSKNFERNRAHYSNLYYGASLPALVKLGKEKGYALVTCNSAGNNAFFVKKNLLNDKVKELSIKEAFQERKFRESRDKKNNLTFLNSAEEKELISHLTLEEV